MSTNISVRTMEQIQGFMRRKGLPMTAGQISRLRGGSPKHNREILNEMVAKGFILEASNQQYLYKPIEGQDDLHILKVYYPEEPTQVNRHDLGVSESVTRLIKCLRSLDRVGEIDWMNDGWLTPEEASFTVPYTNDTGKPDAMLKFPCRFGGEERWFVDTVVLYVEYDRGTKKPKVAAKQIFNYARYLDFIFYEQWYKSLHLDIWPKLLFITTKESQARKIKAALEELAKDNEHVYGDILARVNIWITWAEEMAEVEGKCYWFVDERWGGLAENIWMRAGSDEEGFFLDESWPSPLEGEALNRYRLFDAKRRLSEKPYNGEDLYEVGRLHYLLGDTQKAKSLLWDAEKAGFESDEMFYVLGKIFNRLNEPAVGTSFAWLLRNKAKEYFLKALDINPQHEESLSELAEIKAQEELEEAAKRAEKELESEEVADGEEEPNEEPHYSILEELVNTVSVLFVMALGIFGLVGIIVQLERILH